MKAIIILAIVCLTILGMGILASLPKASNCPQDLLPNVTFSCAMHGVYPFYKEYPFIEVSHDTFINLALDLNITKMMYYYGAGGSDRSYSVCYFFRYIINENSVIYFWTYYEFDEFECHEIP
jgi:hypothetical protein